MKSIKLKNFQGHKDSSLELHPGVNIITGTSDKGKSSIIRSIEWVRTNRPLGTEMIRELDGEQVQDVCEVIIVNEKGMVGRRRKGKENVYICNDEVISASGTEVPEQVRDLLCLDDINVQSQHDEIFLLGPKCTSGEVARELNRVANLEQIDIALSSADRYVRMLRKDREDAVKGVERHTESLKAYEGLSDVGEDLKALEALKKSLQQKEREADILEGILDRYDAAMDLLEATPDLTVLRPKIAQVEGLLQRIEVLSHNKQSLERLLDRIESSEDKLKQAEKDLENKQKEFNDNFPDICPLCGMIQVKRKV